MEKRHDRRDLEVWPADGRKQNYLDIAASLKPEL